MFAKVFAGRTQHAVAALFIVLASMAVAPQQAHAADWNLRAAETVKASLTNYVNTQNVVNAILSYTHPTGNNATLASVETAKSLDYGTLTVKITINWDGGLSGHGYATSVSWKFNRFKHIEATVSSDNAAFAVSDENKLKLDKYFSEWFDVIFPAQGR